ncbi:acylphosphatase [Sphingomonas sp. MMS24-J13]|uniref:acylphosphatase n=1 Tax=Sphingomonas sp. MMS24-J13 TaxID=3238686 RepID=UPI00384C6FD1
MTHVYTGSMTIARRIRIEGRVQGVFFRDWTIATASRLSLTGWVRNCRDGSVEAFAIGEGTAVEQLIIACHAGPDLARVRSRDGRRGEIATFTAFGRRPDA